MSLVCADCGVAVGETRTGKIVHTDELPDGAEVHDVTAVTEREAFTAATQDSFDLRRVAQDMLIHHGALHPLSDCEWAKRLEVAIRGR